MSYRALSLLAIALPCLVFLASAGTGQESTPDLKGKVKQLVEQLADPDKGKQEAAVKELIKLGPDVLPLLPKAGAVIKAAQGKHLETVIEALRGAEALKGLVPRLVTLQGDAIPLSKALAEIAQQAGVEVEDQRREGEDVKLKLNLKQATFWQAIDAVAREADARVYPYRGGKVALMNGPHREMPTSYNGIFRVVVKRITPVQDFESGTRFYQATLEVAWEPRIRAFLLDTRPQSLVVKDDKDRSLPVEGEEGGGKTAVDNPIAMTIDLRLPPPARSAAKLNLLKGNLAVVGASKMLDFTSETLDQVQANPKAREQTQEGVTFKLGKPILSKNVWKLEVSLEYPPTGPDFESFQSWVVYNEIFLVREKTGERLKDPGYAIDSLTRDRATITYDFVGERKLPLDNPANWRVLYRTPGAITEMLVPFEFKDLALP